MTARIVLIVHIAALLAARSASAQSAGGQAPLASRFVDSANGLSLEQAIVDASAGSTTAAVGLGSRRAETMIFTTGPSRNTIDSSQSVSSSSA